MIRKEDVQDIYPLSPMQEGMLFHALMGEAQSAYHETLRIRFGRKTDAKKLMHAWQMVVARHDALRRVFVADRAKTPVQMVLKTVSLDFLTEDLSLCPETLEDRISHDRILTYAMEEQVPMRIRLYCFADESLEMVWQFHHILLDGWSIGIVLEDLVAFYGDPAVLMPPPPDTRDYVRWLQQCDLTAAAAYWQSRLEHLTTETLLIGQTGNKTPAPYVADVVSHLFSKEKSNLIYGMASQFRVTVSAFLEAIWRVLLYRYTGTSDAVFGRVMAGRPALVSDMEKMAGLFIQTVPVRVPVTGNLLFTDLCRMLLEDAFGAEAHLSLPLAEIQSKSPLKGALVSHILVVESFPALKSGADLTATNGLTVEAAVFTEHSSYDFELVIHPEETLDLAFRFNRSRMEASAVLRIRDHFIHAVERVLEDPGIRVGEIDIFGPWEADLVTPPPLPFSVASPDLVLTRLAKTVAASPSSPAVITEETSLTFAAFHLAAGKLAAGLLAAGVGPGVPVGISMERSVWLPVAIFGVLMAGGCWVPMDPAHPPERNAYIRENSGAVFVVGDTAKENTRGIFDLMGTVPASVAVLPSTPAYRIYTSGTTGKPKGVTITHENLAGFAENMMDRFGFDKGERILAQTTVTFDISILEMVLAPACGMTVVLADTATCKDPDRLLAFMETYGVSAFQSTPSLLKLLFGVAEAADPFPLSLKTILVGGEGLFASLAVALREIIRLRPDLRVINVYGPTEATIWSTAWDLAPGPVQVGTPLAGETVYILSEDNRPVPVGAVGEIVVAGAGVGLGYHLRPELDPEKFQSDPFHGGRMYRTGDLGIRHEDGGITCLGRVDHQVKIRGNRIEPDEVASAVLRHPSVTDAFVAGVREGEGYVLCCWVVTEEKSLPPDIREHARQHLMDAMVPDYWVSVAAIPLNTNGKADMNALPLPARAGKDTGAPPSGACETTIAGLWCELLGLVSVGREEKFFALGGHSLKAMQLLSRIRKAFGVRLTVQDLFRATTVSEQAALVQGVTANGALQPVAAPRLAAYPLSPGQKRLWLLESRNPGGSGYNTVGVFLVTGGLDANALSAAWEDVLDRHESLRTVYGIRNGLPSQMILASSAVFFTTMDRELVAESAEETKMLERMAAEEGKRVFSLAAGPLLRVCLIRLSPGPTREDRHALFISCHHIASDGWSDGILARDVSRAYNARKQGAPPEFPPLPFQYRDYAWMVEKWLGTEQAAAEGRFWQNHLRGIRPLAMPLDFPRPAIREGAAKRVPLAMGREIGDALRKRAAKENRPLFPYLLAALSLLLYRNTGETDFVIGTPSAGRWHADLEGIVGFFLNLIPVRIRFSEGDTAAMIVDTVVETMETALSFERYPFDRIVEDRGGGQDTSRHPVFDVMLVFHTQESPRFSFGDTLLSEWPVLPPGCRFDLDFELFCDDRLSGFLDYDPALFLETTATGFAGTWQEACAWILQDTTDAVMTFRMPETSRMDPRPVMTAPLSEDF